MRQYYSQYGEDYLIWSLFKRQTNRGFFVEVGGLDGIRFSNTYSFEQAGWIGVCVEPHPDYFPLLKKNRPGSICVEAAAGNREGTINFLAEPRGDFSTTIEKNIEDENVARKMTGYRKITVPVKTLTQILQEANAPEMIDVVSIDVEGAEMNVLEGFDLSRYHPRVFVIEANDGQADAALDAYMKARGYFKAGRLARTNNFYCRDFLDVLRLVIVPVNCTVSLAPHPLQMRPGVDDEWKTITIHESGLFVIQWRRFWNRLFRRIGQVVK